MNHTLRCRCGSLQGFVDDSAPVNRGVCYCKDCQAYAHFLGKPGEILDAMGGTDVIATLPKHVTITRGKKSLACMSLTEKGMLRWYARCCNTPIGNTGRNPKMPFVGLIHNCLEGSSKTIESSFGPVRMHVNTGSAKGKPEAMRLSTFFSLLGFGRHLLRARLDGSHKTPFFDPNTGKPVVHVKVLGRREHERLMRDV